MTFPETPPESCSSASSATATGRRQGAGSRLDRMPRMTTADESAATATRQRPRWDDRVLTYSPSYTVDVTYRCAKRCGYCVYRSDEGGLVPWERIDAQLDEARRLDAREVLIMSGEEVWLLPDLGLRDEADFVERVIDICRRALRRGLLPHTNVGLLTHRSLAALRPYNASMGLMLESVNDTLRANIY